jgi:hypothetical protein
VVGITIGTSVHNLAPGRRLTLHGAIRAILFAIQRRQAFGHLVRRFLGSNHIDGINADSIFPMKCLFLA